MTGMDARIPVPAGIDTSSWTRVGSTSNAEVYLIKPSVLGIVPHENCVDTEATARESLALQERHWRSAGHRGGTVVFMDQILDQEAGARNVYATETRGHLTTGFALVGESFFAMAVSAVFTGLAKPAVPTQVFKTLDDALPWLATCTAQAEGNA